MYPKRYLAIVALAITAQPLAACSGDAIINDGAAPSQSPVQAAPTTAPRPSNANLVNAFDFYAQSGGQSGYFFTTPSGTWRCAIIPHEEAGCRSAKSSVGLAVTGAPETVVEEGAQVAPNALVVASTGDPYFTKIDGTAFVRDSGPDQTLQFGQILAAAGFRCNVQNLGISCLSEMSTNGFTFSGDGFTLSYTDLPAAP